MIPSLAYCLLGIVAHRCEAQGNLVPNPSYELTDTCPHITGFQTGGRPLYWESWNESPEYFHACAGGLGGLDTLLDVPQNGFGYQHAWNGNAYLGLYAFSLQPEYREHVGCQLISPLVLGQTYHLSFRSNLAMDGTYSNPAWACNNLGMLFTMTPHIWTGGNSTDFEARNYGHLVDPVVNTDSAGWTLVSGTFVADSAYPYLVIGNFFEDALTDTVDLSLFGSLGAYYFVDSVRVCGGSSCQGETGLDPALPLRVRAGPNPVSEVIHVSLAPLAEVEWVLLDAAGRTVSTGNSRNGEVVVPVHDRPGGLYSLLIRGEIGIEHLGFVVMH